MGYPWLRLGRSAAAMAQPWRRPSQRAWPPTGPRHGCGDPHAPYGRASPRRAYATPVGFRLKDPRRAIDSGSGFAMAIHLTGDYGPISEKEKVRVNATPEPFSGKSKKGAFLDDSGIQFHPLWARQGTVSALRPWRLRRLKPVAASAMGLP